MAFTTEHGHELIRKYKLTGEQSVRNEIVLYYSPVVKYIASAMRNIYSKYADYEDIINEGFITLMGAVEQFSFDKKVRFETFASIKLRGSIIDYVRKHDWIPRSSRQMARAIDEISLKLTGELGRPPNEQEVADGLNVPKDKLNVALADVNASHTQSFEQLLYENEFDIIDDSTDSITQAEKQIYLEELKGVMVEVIDHLTEKERLVVSLFYYEELKFTDIAKILEVSTSRISQLHSQALVKLKAAITNYQYGYGEKNN